MKIYIFSFLAILICSTETFGQFTSTDFIIKTIGLSQEYADRYKEKSKIEEIVKAFNQHNIPQQIAPVEITVRYEYNEGYVFAKINYDNDLIYSRSYNKYYHHNRNWSGYGKGVSVLLPSQIFTVLSQYKKSVATKGFTMDKELLRFKSAVILEKSNGDQAYFYAYNYLNSNGFYPFTFRSNAHLKVNGIQYDVKTVNPKNLRDIYYFFIGKTTGLDGSKTGSFYFSEFFEIEERIQKERELEEIRQKELEQKRKQKEKERNELLRSRIDEGFIFDQQDLSSTAKIIISYDEIIVRKIVNDLKRIKLNLILTISSISQIQNISIKNSPYSQSKNEKVIRSIKSLVSINKPGVIRIDDTEFNVNSSTELLINISESKRFELKGDIKKFKNNTYSISNLTIQNWDHGYIYIENDRRSNEQRPQRFKDIEIYKMLATNSVFSPTEKGKMNFNIHITDYNYSLTPANNSEPEMHTIDNCEVEINQ